MVRLVTGIILSFIISAVSVAILIYVPALVQVRLLPGDIGKIRAALFSHDPAAGTTPLIFSAIFTGTTSYIVLKAIRMEQPVRLKDLLGIFKSFLVVTTVAVLIYHTVFYLTIHNHVQNDFFVMIIVYFRAMLPVTWIFTGIYWIRVYTAKFQNNSL